jgi:hypothetical protein
LNAPVKEKIYTIAGKQFLVRKFEGRPVLIVKALYGLRSSGKAFRNYLANNLREMGYTSSKADPDFWMKADVKSDGTGYYHYVICYVDDVAAMMESRRNFMDELSCDFVEGRKCRGTEAVSWSRIGNQAGTVPNRMILAR